MAPAVAKRKSALQSSATATETAILTYLQEKNRPYSVNDIVLNLHSAYPKAAAQKALSALVKAKRVTEKAYGKQTVYVASQDEFEIPTPEELESMDTLLASLKETLSSISAEQKTLAAELQVLSSKPTLKALRANIATLSANNAIAEQRMHVLSSTSGMVDLQEKKALDAKYSALVKQEKKIEQKCMNVVHMLAEGLALRPPEVMEQLGLERPEIKKSQ
ncbi:hypothetical protein MDAP_000375 [Mitosporidium daphniae]